MTSGPPPEVLAGFGLEAAGAPTRQGGGHINSSWIIPERGGGRWLLQRLNPAVFPDGLAVARNGALVSQHLARAAADTPDWRVPRPRLTTAGAVALTDAAGGWWRCFGLLEGVTAIPHARTPAEAHEVGRAFGRFHAFLADYAGPPLTEILPGFHDTPARFARVAPAAAGAPAARRDAAAAELRFAEGHADWAGWLAGAALPRRVTHNDAKAANVLLDAGSGRAVAVVDLDTVMHGTLLHDVGDLLRSTASAVAEDAPDVTVLPVELEQCRALFEGFAAGLGQLEPAPEERELLVAAGVVITFEQGLRFLTDYLDGDRYYRVERPGQNLDRTRVQFALAAALDRARAALERLAAAALRR